MVPPDAPAPATAAPTRRRPRLRGLLAIIVSGSAAVWFAWGVDWGLLGKSLASVKLQWVALASLILLGEFVLRAFRWRVLLRPLGLPSKVTDLFAATVIGAAVNTFFPFRAGEVAKPVVAARRTGHPLAAVVATAVMERVYDLFGLLTVLLIMVIVLPEGAGAEGELVTNLKRYGGLFGVIAFCCMGIFFFLATRRVAARSVFERILSLAPPPARKPFLHLFDGFVSGLGNARDLPGLFQAGALSIWLWVDGALAIACLFRALDMDLHFGAACFTAVAIALSVVLPQAPGFIGVFHVAMEKTMVLWGQPVIEAKTFAIVFWGVSFLPVAAVGLLALWREGLAIDDLKRLAPAPPPDPESP